MDYSVSGTASLVGVHQAGTSYDSGTITATIAGYPATATWGQTDTAASVAGHLVSAINTAAGSVITATLDTNNANYIDLSSRSTGASTNYSVSVTANDTLAVQYPNLLTNPSFSAVGDNMAGGANAVSSYGTIYSYAAAYAQNGNILAHADSVMGTWNFSYDAVDRLMTAQQTAYTATSQKYAGNYGCWNWSYDSFGNRTLEAYSATASCGSNLTPQALTTYIQSGSIPLNNRISSSTMSPNTVSAGSYVYDASGNTLYDGVNEYWYDAEGQLCAVQRTIGGTITQYIYDAEGARIGKGTLSTAPATGATCAPPMSSGFTLATRWLVGLGGDQVTELSEQGPPTPQTENWAHSNVFSASRLTATYDYNGGHGGIHFELADPLGTKRVQANAYGQVEEYCTSLPFGNDLTNPIGLWGTSCNPPSGAPSTADDATEHHFTGKERDSESGNDYFGARYYASSMGRWMSPDLSPRSIVLQDPQSWNRYVYVLNKPLIAFDPDGNLTVYMGGTGNGKAPYAQAGTAFNAALSKFFNGDRVMVFQWSGSILPWRRMAAARDLRSFIDANLRPGEKLNLAGHSHGGNVEKLYTKLPGHESVDTLLTLGTPNRQDIRVGGDVADYINVYSHNDPVQGNVAGPFWCLVCSSDISDDADENIEVSDVNGQSIGHGDLHSPGVLDSARDTDSTSPDKNATYWDNVRANIRKRTEWN